MNKTLSRSEDLYDGSVFKILMEYEVTRSNRYPAPLSLMQIEIISTAIDEKTRSAAPSLFASALNSHLRSVDIPSNTGNRFKILLPTTNEAGARAVCERLLSVFRTKFNTQDGTSIAFTLNIGCTAHSGGESLTNEILLEKSETALKQATLKGPNTYVIIS